MNFDEPSHIRIDFHPTITARIIHTAMHAKEHGLSPRSAFMMLLSDIGHINEAMTQIGNPPRPAWPLCPPTMPEFCVWLAAVDGSERAPAPNSSRARRSRRVK